MAQRQNNASGTEAADSAASPPAWQALKPGDSVYLIAPSGKIPPAEVVEYKAMLEGFGLKVVMSPELTKQDAKGYYNWSDAPEPIADQIADALNYQKPGEKMGAIIALKGGAGAIEVAEVLNKRSDLEHAPNRGIPLIGYSDNTFLQLALARKGLVSPVQGPTHDYLFSPTGNAPAPVDQQGAPIPSGQIDAVIARNREHLKDFLMREKQVEPPIRLRPLNQAARDVVSIEGTVIGGADVPIQLTRYSPNGLQADAVDKPILMLEGKTAEDLRDTLAQLKETGELAKYQAIVLSRYYANTNTIGDLAAINVEPVQKALAEAGVTQPVFFGAEFGHPLRGAGIKPVPLNVGARITPHNGEFALSLQHAPTQAELERSARYRPTARVAALNEPDAAETPVLLDKDKLEPIQINGPGMAAGSPVVGGNIGYNHTWLPDIDALYKQDMAGKHVVVHLGMYKDIDKQFPADKKQYYKDNPQELYALLEPGMMQNAQLALVPLIASGKLDNAASLTVSADLPLTGHFKQWLKEFSARNLPALPVQAAQLDGQALPHRFSGKLAEPEVDRSKKVWLTAILERGAASPAAGWKR